MELHSMELHSINCCFSTRIKFNTNIFFMLNTLEHYFFKISLKIDKNLANAYACYKKYSK